MTVWKLTQEDKLGKEIKIAWLFINRLYNVRQADSPYFQWGPLWWMPSMSFFKNKMMKGSHRHLKRKTEKKLVGSQGTIIQEVIRRLSTEIMRALFSLPTKFKRLSASNPARVQTQTIHLNYSGLLFLPLPDCKKHAWLSGPAILRAKSKLRY